MSLKVKLTAAELVIRHTKQHGWWVLTPPILVAASDEVVDVVNVDVSSIEAVVVGVGDASVVVAAASVVAASVVGLGIGLVVDSGKAVVVGTMVAPGGAVSPADAAANIDQ